LIREEKPNLLLVHLLNLDAVHHRYGPQTWAGYSAVTAADGFIREILKAVDEAGIRETTTVFVVADHGFTSIPKSLRPNVLLRQAGLLTLEGNRITAARVHVVPEGGIGMLYFTVPDTEKSDRENVLKLFRDQEGIAEIVTPEQYARYGLPQPDEYPQMADLILAAKDGYGFDGSAVGDAFVVDSEKSLGTHGFLSTSPKMNATFVASGAGIKPGVKLGVISNTQVAPTIAQLLKLKWPASQGEPLKEIMTP
jgi:predicted AlkP superfamily pyrophosphatase or phosphodiesterase